MPRRRTALTGLTSLAALVLSSGSAHAAPAGPRLIRDVQAGRDTVSESAPVQADTTTEPSVAVNPANPLNVVLGYQMGRVDAGGDATNGFATTFDGGRTWTYGKVPGITRVDGGPYDRASDAVVAFGPHNTVYYSSLAFDDTSDQGLRSAVVNSTSHDGGRHWDAFTTVIDDLAGGLNDKNWVTVDDGTGAGHHPGRVYVAWDRIDPMLASYSDDEGRTWAAPSLVYPGPSIGATPLVQPSGDLAVVLEEDVGVVPVVHPSAHEDVQEPVTGLTRIAVAVAHGAGSVPTGAPLAFAPAVTVATYQNNPVRQQRAGTLPSADVDPRTGRLYVTWEDARYRSDLEN
ncbi:MAG TPA: sialidase family protein, partial [Mycobacteriales bacterium]|nr:sialidase family protein [Mycobacteriales bacterium]